MEAKILRSQELCRAPYASDGERVVCEEVVCEEEAHVNERPSDRPGELREGHDHHRVANEITY